MIPPDAEEFTIPDIEVTRLQTVSGTVTDSDGRPVPDAFVLALWDDPNPEFRGTSTIVQQIEQTDSEGRFVVAGVAPEATVRIAAWSGGATTETIRDVPSTRLSENVDLVVSSGSPIAARGRVVDQAGDGVPGVSVVLRHRVFSPLIDAILPDGQDVVELLTDDDGSYASPQPLHPWGEYIAVARAGSQLEANSGWRAAPHGPGTAP